MIFHYQIFRELPDIDAFFLYSRPEAGVRSFRSSAEEIHWSAGDPGDQGSMEDLPAGS